MEKTDKLPIWVFLAFSSIATRKGALLLIWASIVFTIYSVPWVLLSPNQQWVAQLFLIDDWSWVAMMIPVTAWYWLSLKWVDKHSEWPDTTATAH